MKEIITTNKLSIGFQKNNRSPLVLHADLNIHIPKGEFCCLLGPNGAGKSTLLRTLFGFQAPISGEILLNSRSIDKYTEKELSLLLSIVITEKPDIGNFTVSEIVSLGRYPYTGFFGRLTQNDKIKVDEAISIVGIEDLKNRYIAELSDGERQKAMIAKAFAQDTPIIVLDEPTAFLDIPGRIEIMQILRKLSFISGKTILIATHNLELALQFSDKLLILAREKDLATGAPEDLVMQNIISDFFVKEGMEFEKISGSFKIKQSFDQTIQLSGKSHAREWVSRALGKIGYNTGIKGDTGLSIELSESSPGIKLLHKNKEIISTDLIEELIQTVKKIQS